MNLEGLKEILNKLPLTAILVVFLGWLAYDYHDFTNSPDSPLLQKQGNLESLKKSNQEAVTKIKEANEFFRALDVKKSELRALAQQLSEMKATLTEDLDVPNLIKGVITEARKVGLTVVSIKPTEAKKYEYYGEQAFELAFKGVYVQLLVFLERLSSFERIVRIDNIDMKRISSSVATYVELGGVIQLKAYRYLGSKADEVANASGKPVQAAEPVRETKAGANAPASKPEAGK